MLSLLLSLAAVDADSDGARTIVVTGARTVAVETGSKTATPIAEVPASIVVVPRALLEAQDVRSLDAALGNVSAVAPAYGGGYGLADQYVIRGLPMRFLRDGLPDGNSFNGYRRTLADVASIEVLKGPGSALYGRGEAGGSVNVTTLQPSAQTAFAGVLSYGSRDTVQATLDATAPLGSGFAARLIVNREGSDGIRGLTRRFTDMLPTLSFTSGAHVLTLDYDHREQRVGVDNYGRPFTTAGTLASVGDDARFYSPFNGAAQTIDRVTLAHRWEVSRTLSLRAALVRDQRRLDLTRNAGGNAINASGVMTGRGGRTQNDRVRQTLAQVEAVLGARTGAVAHTLLLGTEYAEMRMDTRRVTFALPNLSIVGGQVVGREIALPATTLNFDRRITSQTLAVYAQEEAKFGDLLRLRAGVRLDAVKLVDNGVVNTTARRIAGSPELVSWQVGALAFPGRPVSLYAGYAAGRYIAIANDSAALTTVPETSSQLEAGVKVRLANTLTLDAAVFETRRDAFFVTLSPGADPLPVGKQVARGVELDLVYRPAPGWEIDMNGSYVNAVSRATALASVTGIATNVSTFGKPVTATPRWQGGVWIARTAGRFRFGVGANGRSSSFADALGLLRVPGFVTARASVSYTAGPIEVQLTAANLFDRAWYTSPTFIGALPGEPRTLLATIRARF